MSERDAFLAAIRARPNDDLPRLVFADWLNEHGENARAEFIRLQCELANLLAELDRALPVFFDNLKAAQDVAQQIGKARCGQFVGDGAAGFGPSRFAYEMADYLRKLQERADELSAWLDDFTKRMNAILAACGLKRPRVRAGPVVTPNT
jgi:uncharacterized protein (TIGR02996 family)